MNTEAPPPNNKPQWLTRLEEESWQAELIISGLAIYGTLQLPGLVEWLMDWCLAGLDPRFFLLMYLFFTYLGIGVYVLIFTFIGHFVLRAVWIGLVGLNSVYPEGVNLNSKTYAPHFIRQFREDHPDQNNRIDQLDKLCSVLFALGAQLVMIFMAINIDIVVIGVLWFLIDSLFGTTVGSIVSIGFFALFILYTLFFVMSNLKQFREKPLVKKWQYPIYKKAIGLLMHLFARPASYLAMVFQTNLTLKSYSGLVVLIMLVVMFFFGARFFNYRFLSFIRPEMLHEQFDRSDRLIPEHYASLRQGQRRLLSLELERDVISSEFLRVFVPVFTAENANMDSLCGNIETTGTDAEKTAQHRAFYLDCYQKLHRFYVNDSLYQTPEMIRYEHPNQGEEGVLIYLPTAHFRPGKNILRVEKNGPLPGSVWRQMTAVFWFEQEARARDGQTSAVGSK